ncbi:TraB/GumN family protein [Sphingomonas sp. LR55]
MKTRLGTPGTVFIAVGAGHLAGKDSVQAQLAKLGVKAERVKY